MDRPDIKNLEMKRLREAYKGHPELFAQSSYLEDDKLLREFGIVIPGKEAHAEGYLKLYASDFIVEEILPDGTVSTIGAPAVPEAFPVRDPGNDAHRALFATLVKCNISTLEAVEEMAARIGCPVRNIHYAGLKDKNAVTAQAISFHDIDFSKVQSLASAHYFLKDLRFSKGSVEKGNLKGNRFSIFVRTPVPVDEASLRAGAQGISERGFYNFYWLQRFGVPRLVNYHWGFDILRGRYKEAVIGYLTDTNGRENGYFGGLRRQISALVPDWKKIQELIEPFPLIMQNENRMVAHLLLKPEDHRGALQAVEDQAMLWVYGVASLLFNEKISTYVQTEQSPPQELPLLLSDQREDIDFYGDFLRSIKYYPPEFASLKPFPKIRLQHRTVKCMEKARIDAMSAGPQGVALRFSLAKGQYATTLLAHLFNMVSGKPPEEISNARADVAGLLGGASGMPAIERFKAIDISKKDFSLDELEQPSA